MVTVVASPTASGAPPAAGRSVRSWLLPTNNVVGTSAENRPPAFERVVATVTQESPTRRSTRTGRAAAGRLLPLTRRSPAVRTDSDDGSSATEAGGPAAPAAVTRCREQRHGERGRDRPDG